MLCGEFEHFTLLAINRVMYLCALFLFSLFCSHHTTSQNMKSLYTSCGILDSCIYLSPHLGSGLPVPSCLRLRCACGTASEAFITGTVITTERHHTVTCPLWIIQNGSYRRCTGFECTRGHY